MSFVGAFIGGSFDCIGAQFRNPTGDALNAQGAEIAGSTLLSDRFRASGRVDFAAAVIKRALVWRHVESPHECELRLESARVGTLNDEEASWPAKLHLDGLVYDRIKKESPLDAKPRLRWVSLQGRERFLPQPYQQLANVLKAMGHEEDARKVLVAMNRDPARLSAMRWWHRPWHNVLGLTIGYGYRPWRALVWMAAFVALGSVLFGWGKIVGDFERTHEKFTPPFNAIVYSIDSFVPVIDLGQAEYWQPTAPGLRLYWWLHISAGWLLTTLLAAGTAGLVRR